MAERRPTEKQVTLLRAVADGQVRAYGGRSGEPTYRGNLGYGLAPVTSDVKRLLTAGWVEHDEPGGDNNIATLRLTRIGEALLRDADDRAEFHAIPDSEKPNVRVTRRDLGRSAIRGMGGPGVGRNVDCWDCYNTARAAGRYADPTVWFTNESGQAAQRDALQALIRHTLRHTRGEISTPEARS